MGEVTDYADQLTELGKAIKGAGGPGKWVAARITDFIIGMVIGTATGIADDLATAIGAVEGSLTYAGAQARAGFSAVEHAVLGVVDYLLAELAVAAMWAGPLGPLVYLVAAAIGLALLWRIGRAVADSVPIASGVQTLLEGR